eukprot:scaffold435_cov342-Pavlova_lutheri.AAC.39
MFHRFPELGLVRSILLDVVCERQLGNARPVLLGGSPAKAKDQLQLVDLRLSLQKWFSQHQFGHDASGRPRVYLVAVFLRSQEELRRTVPQGDHSVGQPAVGRFLWEGSGQPEVGQFEHAVLVDEQVGPFDVPVQYFLFVAVVESFQQLFHEALDLFHPELSFVRVLQSGEIVVHVFEDHVDASFVFAGLTCAGSGSVVRPSPFAYDSVVVAVVVVVVCFVFFFPVRVRVRRGFGSGSAGFGLLGCGLDGIVPWPVGFPHLWR